MAALMVHSVVGKGELAKECVWLHVREDIASLSNYILSDTTYTDDNSVSNELRHIFWFPDVAVQKGDWVALMTKDGTPRVMANKQGTNTHQLYWKLGRTVWNQVGDAAVLFTVSTWKRTRV